MYYEINISKLAKRPWGDGYEHLFATAERSCTSERQAREAYRELRARFPEPQYKVDVTCWVKTGRDVTKSFKRKKGV